MFSPEEMFFAKPGLLSSNATAGSDFSYYLTGQHTINIDAFTTTVKRRAGSVDVENDELDGQENRGGS